jgi:hypothetical protein
MVKRSEAALCLTYARDSIPEGEFGFIGRNFCDDCGCGFDEDLDYRMTHRQTWEQPEEGMDVCPHCGSMDCGENEQDHGMRVVNRYSRGPE